ncbi:hypothetical protein PUN28_016675 [Cardiocondyla obscurior]|uniref:J domain-containing protein n=1 Tax=Cardiocondyla obscurior TaxID=286306 RepID=A0AAW2EQB4_9HYME
MILLRKNIYCTLFLSNRRRAIRYNPMQQKNGGAQAIFALAAEAYDVLSDPLRKAVYDQYGEEGLKNGVPRPEGFVKPYVYHGDPTRAFRWNRKPLSSRQSQSPLKFPKGRDIKQKVEPLMIALFLTFFEVFFGGIKKMKIRRLIVVNNDKSTLPTKKILTIPIKPGIPAGTRIVFPEESDQGSAKIPGSASRNVPAGRDSDLHTTVDIFLREALTGTVITLNTVDGRTLRIPITPINRIRKDFAVSRAGDENAEYVRRLILTGKTRGNDDDDVPPRRGVNDEADRLKFIYKM